MWYYRLLVIKTCCAGCVSFCTDCIIILTFYSQKITEGVATSSTGGWCTKISVEDSGQHVTDRKIIPALAKIFTGKQQEEDISDRGKILRIEDHPP